MESDCRISKKTSAHRTSWASHSVILKSSLVFLLIATTSVQSQTWFDCKEIKDCFCFRNDDLFELACPKQTGSETDKINAKFSAFDVDSKRKSLSITCDDQQPEFHWQLLHELNLNKTLRGTAITHVEIAFCNHGGSKDESVAAMLEKLQIDPEDIKYLNFMSRRKLPEDSETFPDYMFPLMPNLEVLSISDNYLIKLPNMSLFPSLKILNAQKNSLVKVTSEAFSANTKLETVILQSNKIETIEDGALPASVKDLQLAGNNINKLTNTTFANLVNLQGLLLSNNPLEELDPYAFSSLVRLTMLRLDFCAVPFYPVLDNLPSLRMFSMSYSRAKAFAKDQVLDENSPPDFIGAIQNLPALEKLSLSNNKFKALPMLSGLPNLTEFIGIQNQFRSIPSTAFSSMPSLRKLDLSSNRIETIGPLRLESLVALYLNNNNITSVNDTTFYYMVNLTTLNLAKNQIRTIGRRAFDNLRNLQDMDLSYNQVTFAELIEGQSPLRKSVNLVKLNMSHNELSLIPSDFQLHFKLSSIDLSYNLIKSFTLVDLSFINTNVSLSLAHNKIETTGNLLPSLVAKLIDVPIYNKLIVDFKGNPLKCDCNALHLKTWPFENIELRTDGVFCAPGDYATSLTGLSFNSLMPEDFRCRVNESCPESCSCWRQPHEYRNNSSIIIVDCKGQLDRGDQIILPRVNDMKINGYPQDFQTYEIDLDLRDNNISAIPEEFMRDLSPKLRTVDLTENLLRSVQFLTIASETNNRTRFNITRNLFSCQDCSFHLYTRSQMSRIGDTSDLNCLEKPGNLITFYDEHIVKKALEYPYEDVCAPQQFALILIPCVLMIFIIFTVAYFYLRYGWAIRAYLYSKGYGFVLCDSIPEDDEEKIYDAFVSYSHGDEGWVLDNLVNKLEGDQGFKLCLHFRDWVPGDWIPDQIVRSVDQSRRTVVVLSKNFVDSIWSRLEFKAAHSRALSDRSNRLILILKGEDLTDNDVQDDDLRVYMKMNTYIKWDDPWFWHKLKYALPHRKCEIDRRQQLEQIEQRERALQLEKLRKKMESQIVA